MKKYFFNGMDIYVTGDVPRMQLSAKVCEVLSPAMVTETNQWLLEFFGTENILPDGQAIAANNALHMNPRTYDMFLKAMSAKVVDIANYRR